MGRLLSASTPADMKPLFNRSSTLAVITVFAASFSGVAAGQSSTVGHEATEEDLNDLMGWTRQIDRRDNTRFSWDYSLRGVHAAGTPRTGMLGAIGADLYHVFSSAAGDIGTLRLQGYALHADGLPMTPPFFDSAHDWEWTYRFFDFNYTRYASQGVNLRLGHFEVPYGLEQTQATNGTLRDYFSKTNLGIKADWGLSLNGENATHEYEFGLMRGSGNYYKDLDENYVFAGRVGTAREHNLAFGASFMSARLPAGGLAHRERLGIDVIWNAPIATVLGELNIGSDEDVDIASGLFEVNVTSPDERKLAYAQLLGTDADGDDKYWANIGVLNNLSEGITLSAQWQVDLDAIEGSDRSESLMLQLRYRF